MTDPARPAHAGSPPPEAARAPSVPSPLLRDARIEDLPAIVRIYNEAIASGVATFDLEPHTVEGRTPWFEAFGSAHPILAAEIGGAVAGFAYYLPYRGKGGYAFTKETTIYVDAAFRGGGVGAALYRELIARARAAGVHVLVAVLGGENHASEALHRKFGFELVGAQREVGRKFERWVDAKIFQVVLD